MWRSPKALIYIWAFFTALSVLLSIWLAAKEGAPVIAFFEWLWAFIIFFGSVLLVYSTGALVSWTLFPDVTYGNNTEYLVSKLVHFGVMLVTIIVWMKLTPISPFPFAESENSRVRAINAFEAPEWGLKKKNRPVAVQPAPPQL